METTLYNQEGKTVGTYALPEGIFNVPMNTDVLHQALIAQESNARSVIAHTKNRAQVRGGGRKPWRQKGTGRARHGSTRSPLWKGGGVSFGPSNERDFSLKINKKQKQKALFMALSSKVKEAKLALLDVLSLPEIKTKKAFEVLHIISDAAFGGAGSRKMLVVLPKSDQTIALSVRNIPQVKVLVADSLNVKDLLSYRYVVMVKDAVSVIERTYTQLSAGRKEQKLAASASRALIKKEKKVSAPKKQVSKKSLKRALKKSSRKASFTRQNFSKKNLGGQAKKAKKTLYEKALELGVRVLDEQEFKKFI